MLAVIQHHQQLLAGQHPRQRLGRWHSRLLPDPQRRRDHRRNLPRILHRGQLDQPHPVREPARHLPGHLAGQPGLPRTPRPGHRHQLMLAEQHRQLADRPGPADKARPHGREAMHATGRGPARHPAGPRGSRIKPGRGQLEQAHRPVQVLQLMLARIHQREPQALPLLLILDQVPRRLRDQHLPAPRRRADPRRPVHRQPCIPAPRRDGLPGMHPDPHPHPRPARPVLRRQRPLDLQRAQHRLPCTGEHGEERIALGIHLMPATRGDRRLDQPPVPGQHLRVPLPQRLDQPGRPLDVGEHERHRPTRKRTPATPPRPAGRLITGTRHHHRLLPSPSVGPHQPARPATRPPNTRPPCAHRRHPRARSSTRTGRPPHKHDTLPGSQARHITSIYVRSRLWRARHREPIRSAGVCASFLAPRITQRDGMSGRDLPGSRTLLYPSDPGTAPADSIATFTGVRPPAGTPGLLDDPGLAPASRPRIARGPQAPGRQPGHPGVRSSSPAASGRPGRDPVHPCAVTPDQLHRQGRSPHGRYDRQGRQRTTAIQEDAVGDK